MSQPTGILAEILFAPCRGRGLEVEVRALVLGVIAEGLREIGSRAERSLLISGVDPEASLAQLQHRRTGLSGLKLGQPIGERGGVGVVVEVQRQGVAQAVRQQQGIRVGTTVDAVADRSDRVGPDDGRGVGLGGAPDVFGVLLALYVASLISGDLAVLVEQRDLRREIAVRRSLLQGGLERDVARLSQRVAVISAQFQALDPLG